MVDVFREKICYYCLNNNNCKKKVEKTKTLNCTTYKCEEYKKNQDKIVPYKEPLIVTADRDYITKRQV